MQDTISEKVIATLLWVIIAVMIIGFIAAIVITITQASDEPKQEQYIVVEYNPDCDCYQIVDVKDIMKGNDQDA